MDETKSPGGELVQRLAGIGEGHGLAAVLRERAEILTLTGASHDAVLLPRAPGGLSHALRAALAARMARQHADPALAEHYDALRRAADADGALVAVAAGGPASPDDSRLAAIVRHVDLLTNAPRQASQRDIEALREAGVTEPDIVRLSELAAFLSYQARLIAGLRLLAAAGGVA